MELIKKQGDSLNFEKASQISKIHVELNWTQAVDLDLHAFAKMSNGNFEHIYFSNMGAKNRYPYIHLDKDAGVGATAGDNEENLVITKLDKIEYLLIATNIYKVLGGFFDSLLGKGDIFADYDGKVVVKSNVGQEMAVPLTSDKKGKWCIIAKLDNSEITPKLININEVRKKAPQINDY